MDVEKSGIDLGMLRNIKSLGKKIDEHFSHIYTL
jgi:hypothetical protein